MPWFLVDDNFAFHRKAIRAGNAALGLWVRAGSYACDQLTDGVIAADMVGPLGGTEADAKRLVEVGLWEAHPSGYVFHEWPEKLTRSFILAKRDANARRMHDVRSARDVHAHTDRTVRGVRSAVPSRTDPTLSLASQPTPAAADVQQEREPNLLQRRVLKARGAKSVAAVWRTSTEDEREDVRREARALENPTRGRCAEHGTELNADGDCSGCRADTLGSR